MKKRFVGIGVATALTMSLGTAGLAFGATTITQDAKTGTMTVAKDIPVAYTITIPDTTTPVGFDVPNEVSVSGCVLPIGKTLELTATDLAATSDNTNDKTPYAITTGATGEKVLVVPQTEGATKTSRFTFAFKDPAPTAAAKYTATVTFTASLVDTTAA